MKMNSRIQFHSFYLNIKFGVFNSSSFVFLLLFFTLECTVRPPVEIKPGISKQEFRGVVIPAECWMGLSPDSIIHHTREIMNAAIQANYNGLVLKLNTAEKIYNTSNRTRFDNHKEIPGSYSGNFDPVLWAVTEAHRLGLKIFVSFDLLQSGFAGSTSFNEILPQQKLEALSGLNPSWYLNFDSATCLNPAIPEVKSYLKKIIRDFVKQYDLDGLMMDFTSVPDLPGKFSTATDYSPLTDLVEDVSSVAMLVKPYLILTAAFQMKVMKDNPEIMQWLDDGIVDCFIPVIHLSSEIDQNEIIDDWKILSDQMRYPLHLIPGIRTSA